MLFGDILKFAAFFKAGNDGFGVRFFFDQNVARFVFLAAIGCRELVVFDFQFSIGDWVFLLTSLDDERSRADINTTPQ